MVIVIYILGLPTIFHLFAHSIPVEERSRAFGYLIASGSVGQTVASVVSTFKYYIYTSLDHHKSSEDLRIFIYFYFIKC